MVLQKRLEYGFNGYQVPPTPRAARSARRRVPSWKKTEENNQMCAFDLLATVAGKLLQEGETSLNNSADKVSGEESENFRDSTVKAEERQIKEQLVEEEPLNVKVSDQGSCNRSFFVSEIISQAPFMDEVKDCLHPQQDTYSGPASGITVSDCSEKVLSAAKSVHGESRPLDFSVDKVSARFGCKIDGENNNKQVRKEAPNNEKPPVVNNLDNSVKLPFSKDHSPRGPLPACQDNVNLVIRDDDENSSGFTEPRSINGKAFKQPTRIGDRRIRRLLASKYWKAGPKLNDEVHFNNDAELKPPYRNKKNGYKRQRSLRDYPFKKRRLYELDNFSNSDGGVSSDDRCSSPGKETVEDGPGVGVKSEGGTGNSGFAGNQNPAFQKRDTHVKLKIKSFRVPELFIEIPETATVGSLKRTVMEAVTSVLSGELHVGVMLQGKKIRDDNKTLLQTGICHDSKLDALGFTLEPKPLQVPQSLCPEDHSYVMHPDMPKPLARYPTASAVANQVVVQQEVSDASPDPPVANFSGLIESDHDSAPSPPDMSVDNKSVSDSRALVIAPPMNSSALAVVPMRKSKRAEVVQRRIRRPFSVSEVEALVQAVEKLGTGRWRDVKLRAFDNAKHRTYVDLKDKWKTLVHTARISPQQRRGEPVPQELLDRVLAAHAFWSNHQAKQQFKQQQQPETCRLL